MSWITDRLKRFSNIFKSPDASSQLLSGDRSGYISTSQSDRIFLRFQNERSIVAGIYNRIAMDVASVDIRHVKLDELGRYKETIDDSLNQCFSLEPNMDQTARQFFQNLVLSMFDEGVVAVVPVDCSENPAISDNFSIYTMRIGKIMEWYPELVRVKLYNDLKGIHEERVLPKKSVAIIENPFYAIMNDRNSILQRLIRKMNLLDAIDEQSGSGKLDIILQLPYIVRSETKKQQAEERRKGIEEQLLNSKYGIAYIDGTERITQLNRPIENNLMGQIEYLTTMLYSQLGMTKEIFEGTADEQQSLNYRNRTIEPILTSIVEEFRRKFLSKTARSQGQSILYFNDPFKLVPVEKLAEIADKLTRNEVLSSNELRSIIGYKPVDDPRADELRNKNLNAENDQLDPMLSENLSFEPGDGHGYQEGELQNGI